jgi:hypothetical protein
VCELLPWWTVLDDFVPVEVLVQSLVNPRCGHWYSTQL